MHKATRRRSNPETRLSNLLETVLTQPTAPFRESWVTRACLSACAEARLPVFQDSIGNLWVGAKNAAEAKSASLVFVAHLDHPGIVITGFSQSRGKITARGNWLGGGPMDIRNFDVKLFSDVNALMVFDGVVKKHTTGPRGAKEVWIEVKPSPLARAACTNRGLRGLGPWGSCLWYRKQGVPAGLTRRKDLLVTKAADDLVGACALIESLRRAGAPNGVVALLTRAEESGFHGTLAVLEKRVLDPRQTLMISVETSSQLPGAELGRGPVVRLGDRATVFDPGLVFWVQDIAARLAATDRHFQYQRRVMDGGTCEATAFNCFGFQVAGISTPLHNYHNIAASGRPEPEAVSLRDVENLTRLASALMKNHRRHDARTIQNSAFNDYRKRLLKNQRSHHRYFDGF